MIGRFAMLLHPPSHETRDTPFRSFAGRFGEQSKGESTAKHSLLFIQHQFSGNYAFIRGDPYEINARWLGRKVNEKLFTFLHNSR